MTEILTDQEIAATYVARGGIVAPQPLVRWLERHGLGHRNAASIAVAINELLQVDRAERLAASAEGAWIDAVRQGTTANDAELMRHADELALAGQVAAMDLQTFSQNRARFWLSTSTSDFLAGQQ
jgi:hypothetical protein